MMRWLFVVIAILLTVPTLASAQAPQPGTYDVEWSILHVPVGSDLPDLQTGTSRLELEAGAAGVCPPASAFAVRNAPASTLEGGSTTWCIRSDGSFDGAASGNGAGTWNQ
jgi:hypothetical protein